MRLYPGYTKDLVLKEKAASFFRLLDEGNKIRMSEQFELLQLIRVSQAENEDFEEYANKLYYGSRDFEDVLEPDVDETTPEKIKEIFGG